MAPTHPELLDWLGREFIQRGWSMKAMHRLIVTSATYRQISKARPDLAEKDPRNLLLARQERLRLDAEILRDAALSASGLLAPEIGGPSVHPPQAAGVYSFTQNTKKWPTDTGPNRFRRALYTMFYRAAPYPLFTTFDAPNFQSVCTRRARSDTPLQALTVANDATFVEMAQGLAARLLREDSAEDPGARLRRAFMLCLSREPSQKELAILRDYCARQEAGFRNDLANPPRRSFHPSWRNPAFHQRLAAATVCAMRAIFNTDNFITREMTKPTMKTMTPQQIGETERRITHDMTRRHFFGRSAMGLGALALNQFLSEDGFGAVKIDPAAPMFPRPPQLPSRVKNVIYLFMAGGPSQLELFDDKPKLREFTGKAPPASFMKGKRFAFLKGNETLLGSVRKFERVGQCGMTLSELLPHHKTIADEVCWLQGMNTDVFNHGPAKLFMNTGVQAPGRPSMGSWVTYGLGSESRNLPGFVVLQSGPRGPRGGSALWSSGFLPTSFQGVPFRSSARPDSESPQSRRSDSHIASAISTTPCQP